MSKITHFLAVATLLALPSAVTFGQAVPLIRPARPVRPVEDEKKKEAEQKIIAERMNRAIKRLLTGKNGVNQVRLDVNWGGRWVTVYGREGIGIWNREKQFRIGKDKILAIIRLLDKEKFVGMKRSYGGMKFSRGGPLIGAPVQLVGSITLRIGDVAIGSSQIGGGQQSKELAELVGKVLDLCQLQTKDAVTANDLDDGLRKIARGDLHPLTLSLLVQRIEREGLGPNGWILQINGRQAQVRVRSKTGISKPYLLQLTDEQLAAVCKLLLDNGAADLPINLYAPDYTDFRVSIFRATKILQARKFARLTPTTHGEKQKRFDRIFASLDKLQRQVVEKGKQN